MIINAIFDQHDRYYSVNFNTQTDKVHIDTQSIKYSEKAICPEEPFIEGTEFKGWFLDSDGIVEYDFNSPIISDITLFAK